MIQRPWLPAVGDEWLPQRLRLCWGDSGPGDSDSDSGGFNFGDTGSWSAAWGSGDTTGSFTGSGDTGGGFTSFAGSDTGGGGGGSQFSSDTGGGGGGSQFSSDTGSQFSSDSGSQFSSDLGPGPDTTGPSGGYDGGGGPFASLDAAANIMSQNL